MKKGYMLLIFALVLLFTPITVNASDVNDNTGGGAGHNFGYEECHDYDGFGRVSAGFIKYENINYDTIWKYKALPCKFS